MTDLIENELIGLYYVFTYRTKREAHEYSLEILKEDNFKLGRTISGNFGSVGQEWTGNYSIKDNALKLKCTQNIDWKYTFLDEERQDMIIHSQKTFNAKCFEKGNDIKIVLSLELGDIVLYRTIEDISQLTYWITREIIERYELDEKIKNSEPGIYWRISNLIVRDYKMSEGQLNEALCEFDLDIATEEKRVVDDPEFIREHHIDRVIYNEKLKVIKYEILR